jgi:hypothetical protein
MTHHPPGEWGRITGTLEITQDSKRDHSTSGPGKEADFTDLACPDLIEGLYISKLWQTLPGSSKIVAKAVASLESFRTVTFLVCPNRFGLDLCGVDHVRMKAKRGDLITIPKKLASLSKPNLNDQLPRTAFSL